MLIRGLEVVDLLSFNSLDVTFDKGLNVLVGQNDIGKSNLLRLVRLIRDLVVTAATGGADYGFESRYVRSSGPLVGNAKLRVSFTEPSEQAALALFIRAVAAQAAELETAYPPVSGLALSSRFANTAVSVTRALRNEEVSSLFEGHIVLALDARQPARRALAYQFSHGHQIFHIGLQGSGVMSGTVAHGPLDLENPRWSTAPLSLPKQLDPDDPDWEPVSFTQLLPGDRQAFSWDLMGSHNGVQRPLTLELARLLSVAADNSTPPSFSRLLGSIVGQAIVATDNLRRPPRRLYRLDETNSAFSVEDAGDLPLALYRMKNGPAGERSRYADLQVRFRAMTGRLLDLAASAPPGSLEQLDLELQVQGSGGWAPIEQVGSGLWEALIALHAAAPTPGTVALLDEPAGHLHSSWQRQLLRHLRGHGQVIMVTHSPFLVPLATSDDFKRVTRLALKDGIVGAIRVDTDSAPEQWRERWRQIFAGSTDARDVLFSRGVVLVEGDTEVGAFRQWFNDPEVVGEIELGAEARNIIIISVDGDGNFGPWVSYLEQLHIPWLILADGPVLSPGYRHSLRHQLGIDPATGKVACVLRGTPPATDEFDAWRDYWRANSVMTVATTFGLKPNKDKVSARSSAPGEIESWFATLDSDLWAEVTNYTTSKVRRGYRFAEELNFTERADALRVMRELWTAIVAQVDPNSTRAASK